MLRQQQGRRWTDTDLGLAPCTSGRITTRAGIPQQQQQQQHAPLACAWFTTHLVEGTGGWLKELGAVGAAGVLQELLQLACVVNPAAHSRGVTWKSNLGCCRDALLWMWFNGWHGVPRCPSHRRYTQGGTQLLSDAAAPR